jgi:hypothetical protein
MRVAAAPAAAACRSRRSRGWAVGGAMSSTGRGPHHYAPPPEKQRRRKSGNCGLSFIITMLHHDVCLSAFEPKQKVVDAKGKYSRQTDITTHNTMPCPQRTKKKERGNCGLSRCSTIMFVSPPSNRSRR